MTRSILKARDIEKLENTSGVFIVVEGILDGGGVHRDDAGCSNDCSYVCCNAGTLVCVGTKECTTYVGTNNCTENFTAIIPTTVDVPVLP